MASPKPRRNTAPSSSDEDERDEHPMPWRKAGANGFSTMCAVASAADSVIVMMKSVATKPSSTRTKSLPRQHDSSRSSMAIEPSPCGLSAATRRYTGSAPSSVSTHEEQRRQRGQRPGGEGGDAGLVAERGEVVHAGEAHDPPPGGGVVVGRLLAVSLRLVTAAHRRARTADSGLPGVDVLARAGRRGAGGIPVLAQERLVEPDGARPRRPRPSTPGTGARCDRSARRRARGRRRRAR